MLGRRASRLAPPRHRRGTRLGIPRITHAGCARHIRAAITHGALRTTTGHAHYPGGAMGTSRPTAITHAHYPRALHPRITRGPPHRPPGPPSPGGAIKNYAGKSHSNHATPYGASRSTSPCTSAPMHNRKTPPNESPGANRTICGALL